MGAEEVLALLVPLLMKLGELVQQVVATAQQKDAAQIAAALQAADAALDTALSAMRAQVAANRAAIDAQLKPAAPTTTEPKP